VVNETWSCRFLRGFVVPPLNPERCRSAGDGHWEMRPHLTSSTPVVLASSADGATLVYQALARHAPSYLANDCCLVTDARPRRLLSDETRALLVMWARTNFGDTTVSAAGPHVWNYLPTDLRKPDLSYSRFRQTLKTFFGQWDQSAA